MTHTKLFWLLALTLLTVSCRKDVIKGGGSIGTRTIVLPAFSAVESHYDIKAVISYGPIQEVTVTGYDNLLNILDFRVENEVLKLKYNTVYNSIRNGNVVASIKVPAVSSATIHGSQNIELSGFSNGANFHGKIHGSGNIGIYNSAFQSALLEVFGSGSINGQTFQIQEAEANVHGSGNISISVSDRLKAGIFGSGNIYFWGNPVLETTINGTGKVIRK